MIDELKSELIVFYLNDGTLSDDPAVVLFDFMNLIDSSQEIGLQVNPSKCELYFCYAKKLKSLKTMINRFTRLPSHVAYFLLRNCFAIPYFPEWCSDLDKELKTGLESILNIKLDCVQWTEAFLSIKSGGLEIRKVTDIALSAFLASTFGGTLADSHVAHSDVESGYAAAAAAKRKSSKYKVIKESNYIFVAFAVETFGPLNKEAQDLVVVLSGRSARFEIGSRVGMLARIDLLTALKSAMKMADPRPIKAERVAALQLVRFLNSSDSDEYLQAFYTYCDNTTASKVNRFSGFLNGVLFNGNPDLPVWKASEVLAQMIKTKTNPDAIENERSRARIMIDRHAALEQGTFREIDFVKLFNDSRLYSLTTFEPHPETDQ
ncbi:hypothetical protein ILUMI_00370 [Ignelater luminosus]|uniref:Uncharacterized protein n=1 Tax=Ignelater luminosus TaxID=2038154 RepID=A0A8K0GLA7_IGNLU|nr:hypothetical protein ILUMI_00370 [Ignelater luminosus]